MPTEVEKNKMANVGQFLQNSTEFIGVNRRVSTQIRCCKQFTPEVQTRRKKALAVRYDLKSNKQITKGFINYPARLMVILTGADKYTLHSSY